MTPQLFFLSSAHFLLSVAILSSMKRLCGSRVCCLFIWISIIFSANADNGSRNLSLNVGNVLDSKSNLDFDLTKIKSQVAFIIKAVHNFILLLLESILYGGYSFICYLLVHQALLKKGCWSNCPPTT